MRKLRIRAAAIGAVLALAALSVGSAQAKPHVIRAGNLFLRDDGGISPSKLPRHEQVPISAHIDAEIGTTDGSHPPAVKTLNIDFDRSIEIDARGLPVCRKGELEARTTAAAKRACASSVVGSGDGEVEVAFPESDPFSARGPVVLFNGGVHGGRTLLFAHAYVSVPAPTAVVVPVEISRIHRGHYGVHTVTRVPVIAGGSGSVTHFVISIGRRFTYRGEDRSYLTASCPTGSYYTEGEILFRGGALLKGVHILPCTPGG
jgi:hypothetical protein